MTPGVGWTNGQARVVDQQGLLDGPVWRWPV